VQKIIPSLWFDDQAEQAAEFYTSVFPDGKITSVVRYTAAGPGPEGSVMMVDFQINGQDVNAINGGPIFTFSEATSLIVNCADQAEIDYYWEKLSEGGETSQCGWLKDRYGFSWQIVPADLMELTVHSDTETVNRVMEALLTMTKLDIAELQAAAKG